jgi:aspartate aminotransferase
VARDEALDLDFARKLVSTLVEESVRIQTGPQKNRAEYLYAMFEKAVNLESKGRKTIRLDVGEPDITAPQELKNALGDSLYGNDHIGYVSSKGLLELREAVVSTLNERYGIDLEANQVLITPGGKFAIFSAILAMVSQHDRALIPEPTWQSTATLFVLLAAVKTCYTHVLKTVGVFVQTNCSTCSRSIRS